MENHLQYIDDILKNHLQKEISLLINNKPVKTGKFILYNFFDYHVELAIIYKNKVKKTLLPIPFRVEHYKQDNLLFFDYRIKSLYNKLAVKLSDCKYYNTILEIQFK